MTDTSPSAVRVFGKSLYVLAAGWLASVGWVWVAGVRQHLERQGTWPDNYGASVLLGGIIPALALALMAAVWGKQTGPAPSPSEQEREWTHAFWWSLFPNLLLLFTAYVMIDAAR